MNNEELALMDELLITALPHIRDSHKLLVGRVFHFLALHRPNPPELKHLRMDDTCIPKKIISISPHLSQSSSSPLPDGFILAVADE